jgi:hypothetical protein
VKVWRKRVVKRRVEATWRDFAAVTVLWNTTGGRANSGACPRQADESTNSGLRSRIDEVSDKKGSQRRGSHRKGIGGQPDADDRTANAVFLALQAERLAGPTRRWTGRSMWRFGVRAFGVWVVAVGSLILVPSTASVAAEPLEMAPKYYSKQTRDGWQLSISIEGERINSVPNLAAATTSREGFVTHGQYRRTRGSERPAANQPGSGGFTPPAAPAAEPLERCAAVDFRTLCPKDGWMHY